MSLDTSKCSSGGGGAGGPEEDVEGEDKQAGELFLCITYQIKAGFFVRFGKNSNNPAVNFAFKTQSTAGLSLLLNWNSIQALQATGLN